MKKVSVIVPVYNAEKTLRRCVDSLLAQTIIDDMEIILIDDGSVDASASIMKEYFNRYPNHIVTFYQKNSGPSCARNYGLEKASGKYVGFVDSDDYIMNNMYEKMVNMIESQEDIDLVITGRKDILKNKEKDIINEALDTNMSITENPEVLSSMSVFVWDKLYKMSIIKKYNLKFPIHLHYAEDFYFLTLYKIYMRKIGNIKEPLYNYIVQSNNSITNTCNEKWYDIITTLKQINDILIEKGLFKKYNKQMLKISSGYFCRRVKNMKNCNHKLIQIRFVKKFFNYFNYYFSNWKWSVKSYRTKTPKRYRINFILMVFYICVPNMFKRLMDKLLKYLKKLKASKTYYAYCRRFCKVKTNKILFMSYFGGNITDSPYYMMKELCKDEKWDIYVASRNLIDDKIYLDFNNIKNVKLVKVHSKKFIKLLATAKYIINNSRVPAYFTKRKNQILVETWHGTPLKTLGRSMNKGLRDLGNNQTQFLMSDYLLYPNEYTKKLMMRDFCLDNLYSGKVIVSGYPRNEIFFDSERRDELRKKYGLNKKVYVYMPTWRGDTLDMANIKKYKRDLEDILAKLDKNIENAVIFVKIHQIVMKYISISNYKNIKEIHPYLETYDFLNLADALITDYSSVFFDFANTKKEIILFMYDYKEYMKDRGMYFNVEKLPFTKVYSTEELIQKINDNSFKYDEKYNDFVKFFCSKESKENSKKLNDIIFYQKSSDLIQDFNNNYKKKYNIIFCTNLDNDKKQIQFDKHLNESNDDTLFVFDQGSFNNVTNDYIHKNDKKTKNYIVVPNSMPLTVLDKLFITLYKKLGLCKYFCKKIYRKELDRILPGINIKNIENDTDIKKFQLIEKIFKQKR